jgi:cell division protein ZapA
MDALIPINILIGDRSYRIKVSAQDEESVRKTVKQINDKILEFKTGFAGKDMQDYVAMVLVWYASQVQQHPAGSGQTELPALQEELKKLEDRLKGAL